MTTFNFNPWGHQPSGKQLLYCLSRFDTIFFFSQKCWNFHNFVVEEHNFVKENNESSRMFYFRHEIFIINQLLDRHLLELPLYYGMKDSQLKPRCLAKTGGSLILVEYFSKTLDWLEVMSYNQCWWVIAIFAIARWVDHHNNFKIYICWLSIHWQNNTPDYQFTWLFYW